MTAIEDLDESFKLLIINSSFKIIKNLAYMTSHHIVTWRRDTANFPVIKNIVSNFNHDAIILQARD